MLSFRRLTLNATFLIGAAVQHEADFFRLNDNFGHCQQFRVVGDKSDFDTIISLHPFHSTRRIYAHVAAKLNLSISSINLMVIEDSDRRPIPPSASLEVLDLCADRAIELSVQILDRESNYLLAIRPTFCESVSGKPEFLSLFSNLQNTSAVSQLTFQIIQFSAAPHFRPRRRSSSSRWASAATSHPFSALPVFSRPRWRPSPRAAYPSMISRRSSFSPHWPLFRSTK
jgi:hypothetical protein